MNTKHTPGPWKHDGMCIDAIDGALVATVYTENSFVNELDARLIAAAPELLAALQVMVKTFDGLATIHNDAYRQARAAIAKATGQQ